MALSAIQWTTYTFNIVWGCVFKSRGCIHCYAKAWAERLGLKLWGKDAARRTFGDSYWKAPLAWNRAAEKAGKRVRVFCCSMADVFEDHPTNNEERLKLWPLIRATPWLDWQLLTKDAQNIARFLPEDWGNGYPNVWLGVSCEDQENADARIPHLLAVPARVRFLSCEPLLGPLHLLNQGWLATGKSVRREGEPHDIEFSPGGIHWVIVGGESGPEARPMNPNWVRQLRHQCHGFEVAFFFKQWGNWAPATEVGGHVEVMTAHPGCTKNPEWHTFATGELVANIGKKCAGRVLDGREHDEMPEVSA